MIKFLKPRYYWQLQFSFVFRSSFGVSLLITSLFQFSDCFRFDEICIIEMRIWCAKRCIVLYIFLYHTYTWIVEYDIIKKCSQCTLWCREHHTYFAFLIYDHQIKMNTSPIFIPVWVDWKIVVLANVWRSSHNESQQAPQHLCAINKTRRSVVPIQEVINLLFSVTASPLSL